MEWNVCEWQTAFFEFSHEVAEARMLSSLPAREGGDYHRIQLAFKKETGEANPAIETTI